jgi:hypothetical protein
MLVSARHALDSGCTALATKIAGFRCHCRCEHTGINSIKVSILSFGRTTPSSGSVLLRLMHDTGIHYLYFFRVLFTMVIVETCSCRQPWKTS